MHGSISDIKCPRHPMCTWIEHDNFDDPFCLALVVATEDIKPDSKDPKETLPPHIPASELPRCPKCRTGIQRFGVVWFNEGLDKTMLNDIETRAWSIWSLSLARPRLCIRLRIYRAGEDGGPYECCYGELGC